MIGARARHTNGVNGFTLVEVLIASVMALIALAAAPAALRVAGRAVLLARDGTIAVALAQEKIEQLIAGSARLGGGHDSTGQDAAPTKFARHWQVQPAKPRGETRRLSVTVAWDASGHAVTLETVVKTP